MFFIVGTTALTVARVFQGADRIRSFHDSGDTFPLASRHPVCILACRIVSVLSCGQPLRLKLFFPIKGPIMKLTVHLALILGIATAMSYAADPDAASHPIFGQKMKSLAGETVDLSKYRGKVLLIVNTASRCGATPQYADLQKLHETYKDQGLVVLGFPCNQFGAQEPGTADEIAQFCEKNYGVTFDMFAKIDVNGEDAASLYKYLTSEKTGLDDTGPVKWNFEKILISKAGKPVARFRTRTSPGAPEVTKAIEAEISR